METLDPQSEATEFKEEDPDKEKSVFNNNFNDEPIDTSEVPRAHISYFPVRPKWN